MKLITQFLKGVS